MLDIDNVHSLGHSPFYGGIDIVDDVTIVFGDIILNVDNDKCFFVPYLFNYKTTWIKITIETAIGGGELQHAVVGIGHAAGVVLLVAIAPNHFF